MPPPPGCRPTPTSGWPSRVFSRDAKRMSQARTNSLLRPGRSPDLRDADDRRLREADKRIHKDREARRPDSVVMLPVLPVKSKWAR